LPRFRLQVSSRIEDFFNRFFVKFQLLLRLRWIVKTGMSLRFWPMFRKPCQSWVSIQTHHLDRFHRRCHAWPLPRPLPRPLPSYRPKVTSHPLL
jgi:hypothetical protein